VDNAKTVIHDRKIRQGILDAAAILASNVHYLAVNGIPDASSFLQDS
jgi:hypothetical protein